MNNSSKPRLLVVEDEIVVARDIQSDLRKLGYDVVGLARSGEQALQLAESTRPDIALMDIQLQGTMDGIETARLLRERLRVPVVFLTAYADQNTLQRAKSVQPYGYLLKPFDEHDLHSALEVALHKHYCETIALKRAAAALELSEQRYKLLVESLHDYAVFVLDPAGHIVTWNIGAEKTYGYSRSEIIGQHFSIFYLPEEIAANRPELQLMTATREGRDRSEGWRVRKDGSHYWADVVTSAMFDEEGLCGFAKVVRDMTQRKKSDDEIRALNAELEQRVRDRTAELLESNKELEAFTYSAAHDLRAPLRSIVNFCDILRDEAGIQSGSPADALQRIHTSAVRMNCLLDDLLRFSTAGRKEITSGEINLKTVVDEVVSELRCETLHRKVEWQIAPLPTVRADPVLIKQVFVNLIANALKYSRTREHTVIAIGHRRGTEDDTFFIRDNGVGFDSAAAADLFTPFTRFHSATDFEGTGLGLAIVHRIVRRHGGRAWAESLPERGATVSFTLPHCEPIPVP